MAKRHQLPTLLAPGTQCPRCRGDLQLQGDGKEYSFPSGHKATHVPYLVCSTCQQEGFDLALLMRMQQVLSGWMAQRALPPEIAFVHFGIAIPLPDRLAS